MSVPNTRKVVALDIGHLDVAHPTHNREVGDRLARFELTTISPKNGCISYAVQKR
ncbi:hypothetical protein ACVWYG_000617 [Pedobacter sp. UYEF25]